MTRQAGKVSPRLPLLLRNATSTRPEAPKRQSPEPKTLESPRSKSPSAPSRWLMVFRAAASSKWASIPKTRTLIAARWRLLANLENPIKITKGIITEYASGDPQTVKDHTKSMPLGLESYHRCHMRTGLKCFPASPRPERVPSSTRRK